MTHATMYGTSKKQRKDDTFIVERIEVIHKMRSSHLKG